MEDKIMNMFNNKYAYIYIYMYIYIYKIVYVIDLHAFVCLLYVKKYTTVCHLYFGSFTLQLQTNMLMSTFRTQEQYRDNYEYLNRKQVDIPASYSYCGQQLWVKAEEYEDARERDERIWKVTNS